MTDIGLTQTQDRRGEVEISDYFELLKPGVMRLVIFTAFVGMMVAPVSVHPLIGFASLLCVAVGAGASGALNMWWDADIDLIMKRTQGRPIPSGRISGENALVFGLWLSGLSVVFLGLFGNYLAAGLLAFTIFFYAVIYSMWLKRSTPQNIVIGGAAGAFPPMIGWAIATGSVSVESVLMFALIFMWTPPHFWALSLFMNEDYSRAGVPMMTVAKGKPYTRKLILIYAVLLAPVALAIAFTAIGGWVYFAVAVMLNAIFVFGAVKMSRTLETDAEQAKYKYEKKYFVFSIFYLFAHFSALLVDALLRAFELVPAFPILI